MEWTVLYAVSSWLVVVFDFKWRVNKKRSFNVHKDKGYFWDEQDV